MHAVKGVLYPGTLLLFGLRCRGPDDSPFILEQTTPFANVSRSVCFDCMRAAYAVPITMSSHPSGFLLLCFLCSGQDGAPCFQLITRVTRHVT